MAIMRIPLGRGTLLIADPGILVKGDKIEQADVTWLKHEVPYIVGGNMDLGSTSGSKLTIEPGATVNFTSGAGSGLGILPVPLEFWWLMANLTT